MTRRARHLTDGMLDSARQLLLERGVQNATVDAIVRASGAPVGSLYHRFGSRDQLLAELWIRAVHRSQTNFIAAARNPNPERATIEAALAIYDFAVANREDAALLASFRREDLMRDVASAELAKELKDLNRPLQQTLVELARRVFGKAVRKSIEQTIMCTIDIPMGVIRRRLLDGSDFPGWLRAQLEATVAAALRAAKSA